MCVARDVFVPTRFDLLRKIGSIQGAARVLSNCLPCSFQLIQQVDNKLRLISSQIQLHGLAPEHNSRIILLQDIRLSVSAAINLQLRTNAPQSFRQVFQLRRITGELSFSALPHS